MGKKQYFGHFWEVVADYLQLKADQVTLHRVEVSLFKYMTFLQVM